MENLVKFKCDIMWAQLAKVNDMSGKFQVNLCNLSDAAAKALEELGISTLNKEGMGNYITCKSNTPMKAFDTEGDEISQLIGNGSKAKAVVKPYEWAYKNKKGISPSLVKLVITDLVEYASAGGSLDDDELL
jgi:hypothetical protein